MVENAIYRYKTILGGHMSSRSLKRQRIEVQIGCKILNRMALFGMPDSFAKTVGLSFRHAPSTLPRSAAAVFHLPANSTSSARSST